MTKKEMAERIVSMPGWNSSIKSADEMCRKLTREAIEDIYEKYRKNFGWKETGSGQSNAQVKALAKYEKENSRRYSVKFHRENDRRIIEWLEAAENKQQAIRTAILYYIAQENTESSTGSRTEINTSGGTNNYYV